MAAGQVQTLKTHPDPFAAMWRGEKTHEVRHCNDRAFSKDDVLVLREFDPDVVQHTNSVRVKDERYSGRTILAIPTYISAPGSYGLPGDTVVMSLRVIAKCLNFEPA